MDERFFVGSSRCDRAYVLQKHADVDDFKGIETAGIHGERPPVGRQIRCTASIGERSIGPPRTRTTPSARWRPR